MIANRMNHCLCENFQKIKVYKIHLILDLKEENNMGKLG